MKKLILSHLKKVLSLLLTAILLISSFSEQVFALDPKVSIIIPVYNTPKSLLKNCLESAKKQTLKDIEIICVDDGSTDGSGKILDEYAKNDPRFKVVHQKNRGCMAARNKAINLSKGEYIQFLDSDDEIDQTMSEKCYNKAKEFDADIVKCGYTSGWELIEPMNSDEVVVAPVWNFGKHGFIWNGIWKRIFSNNHKLYFLIETKRRADEVFNLTFLPKANKVVYFSEKLYHYSNLNKGSITHFNLKNTKHELACLVKNIRFLYNHWKDNKYFENDSAKMNFLKFIIHQCNTSGNIHIKAKFKLFIDAIGPELLQDDVINLLPPEEKMQMRNIIQAAKSE